MDDIKVKVVDEDGNVVCWIDKDGDVVWNVRTRDISTDWHTLAYTLIGGYRRWMVLE